MKTPHDTAATAVPPHGPVRIPDACGQVVLVLQGGGALGAYQAGVYQAMHEAGIAPDWVIGTSIGAINAALIAGSPPSDRLDRITEFWKRVRYGPWTEMLNGWPMLGALGGYAATVTGGLPGFFTPNPLAFFGAHTPLGPEDAGYYSTAPLAATLSELIDFDLLNRGAPRITVGAAAVATGVMRYFDSRDTPLELKHILASGALPPAFPAIRIDGELFWDGGIVSNTPVEAVFDDHPRRSSLVFAVHIWNPQGTEPDTIWKVITRQKDIQYASRSDAHIFRQRQIHKLRHVISDLVDRLPPDQRQTPEVAALAAYGCVTRMHVVRLLAPPLYGEDHSKDIDFSEASIRARWERGYADTMRVLNKQPWHEDVDPLEGFILHEASAGEMMPDGHAR
ncbi:patatin-like phospholipase family protein [Sphingomonas sp. SFZ2018-12]|uniref:patatin-like phospholipase family protein n=1 Tax=Sphingomonas sp. SFZ2018-12 TaxID=2683197 RepID=UPI001F0F0205|nr:patatin-like phospholipase family protein [Sphingomonas sp. SFZ2018-12]MCH4894522.1 patatin-like phospholipase family protein [Sphingomonas sp. SFZ2018-12]